MLGAEILFGGKAGASSEPTQHLSKWMNVFLILKLFGGKESVSSTSSVLQERNAMPKLR
jgi:hypothetical protein